MANVLSRDAILIHPLERRGAPPRARYTARGGVDDHLKEETAHREERVESANEPIKNS